MLIKAPRPSEHYMMAGSFKIIGLENAKMPQPSQAMYEALALRAWTDYAEQMAFHVGHELPDWDDLPQHLRAVWMRVAHGQVGIVSIFAGGKIVILDAE
jgi:hypothetical protein